MLCCCRTLILLGGDPGSVKHKGGEHIGDQNGDSSGGLDQGAAVAAELVLFRDPRDGQSTPGPLTPLPWLVPGAAFGHGSVRSDHSDLVPLQPLQGARGARLVGLVESDRVER